MLWAKFLSHSPFTARESVRQTEKHFDYYYYYFDFHQQCRKTNPATRKGISLEARPERITTRKLLTQGDPYKARAVYYSTHDKNKTSVNIQKSGGNGFQNLNNLVPFFRGKIWGNLNFADCLFSSRGSRGGHVTVLPRQPAGRAKACPLRHPNPSGFIYIPVRHLCDVTVCLLSRPISACRARDDVTVGQSDSSVFAPRCLRPCGYKTFLSEKFKSETCLASEREGSWCNNKNNIETSPFVFLLDLCLFTALVLKSNLKLWRNSTLLRIRCWTIPSLWISTSMLICWKIWLGIVVVLVLIYVSWFLLRTTATIEISFLQATSLTNELY